MVDKPVAVIDVGSNSVRLVVYSGERRVPFPIFNEKVLAGLGAGLAAVGGITAEAGEVALQALQRFKLLIDHIGAARTHLLATAAVRDASNGPQFIAEIKRLGLPCRVVSPEQEATLAALGVLSAFPDADGIVGDLGGGSLELVDVADGGCSNPISLPLGVLRVSGSGKEAKALLRRAISDSGLKDAAAGRSFYMVGGSWRALARIDMITIDHPLPIIQAYRVAPKRASELKQVASAPDERIVKAVAPARLAAAPAAAMLLEAIVEELAPAELLVSSYGIREGLLFSQLSPRKRKLDPLIEAARLTGEAERRLDPHGARLDEWLSGAFDDPPELARIRLAACLLADAAWGANPEFRADRAVELALHGNWIGLSIPERALLAQALSATFGRNTLADRRLLKLCKPADLQRAVSWGAAMRLGQRLSGGLGTILQRSRLVASESELILQIARGDSALVHGSVERRLQALSDKLQRSPKVVLD